jgi:NADPH:quinone reductase-like Zn-dependent oxidoreductase
MRAWNVTGTTIESLQPVEVPEPAPGPAEVLVRIAAAALNYRDLAVLRGTYGSRTGAPYVPLSDGAGTVGTVGSAVRRVRPGDRVVLNYARDWIAGEPTEEALRPRLGMPLDGTLQEAMVLPEHAVVPLPDALPLEDAAVLPVAGTAAWHALFDFGRLQPGEQVVVQGTGGVSMLALQLATAARARVLVTTRSAAKAALAREHGADTVVVAGGPSWDAAVLEWTAGKGADLLLDVVGGDLSASLRATRFGGRVALIGFLASAEARFDLRFAIQRRLDLRGVSVGPRSSLEALVRAVAALRLRPFVSRTFSFEEAPAAFRALASGEHSGKLLIRF